MFLRAGVMLKLHLSPWWGRNRGLRVRAMVVAMVVAMWLAVGSLAQAEQYAFLVGVREYDPAELNTLAYTENDITALAETLKHSG